jgi:hypothetical protein
VIEQVGEAVPGRREQLRPRLADVVVGQADHPHRADCDRYVGEIVVRARLRDGSPFVPGFGWDHHNRARRVLDAVLADGSEHEASEAAAASATHHKQVSAL